MWMSGTWQNTCSLGYTTLSQAGHRLPAPYFGPMVLRLSEGCVVELQMKDHTKVRKHREDPY